MRRRSKRQSRRAQLPPPPARVAPKMRHQTHTKRVAQAAGNRAPRSSQKHPQIRSRPSGPTDPKDTQPAPSPAQNSPPVSAIGRGRYCAPPIVHSAKPAPRLLKITPSGSRRCPDARQNKTPARPSQWPHADPAANGHFFRRRDSKPPRTIAPAPHTANKD